MPFCPECGVEMQNAQKYCHACGMEIGRVDGEVDSIPNQPSADIPPSVHFKKTTWTGQWDLQWPAFIESHDVPRLFDKIAHIVGVRFEPSGPPIEIRGTRMTAGDLDVKIHAGKRKTFFAISGRKRSSWKQLIPVYGPIWRMRDMKRLLKRNMDVAEHLAAAIESLLPPAN